MPNKWITALKEWNGAKGGPWCVPRKGSPEYDEVRGIMDGKETPVRKAQREQGNVDRMAKAMQQLRGVEAETKERNVKRKEEAAKRKEEEEAAKRKPEAPKKAVSAERYQLLLPATRKLIPSFKALGHLFWRRVGGGDYKPTRKTETSKSFMIRFPLTDTGEWVKEAYFTDADDQARKRGDEPNSLNKFMNSLIIYRKPIVGKKDKFQTLITVEIKPDYIDFTMYEGAELENYASTNEKDKVKLAKRQAEDFGGTIMNEDRLKSIIDSKQLIVESPEREPEPKVAKAKAPPKAKVPKEKGKKPDSVAMYLKKYSGKYQDYEDSRGAEVIYPTADVKQIIRLAYAGKSLRDIVKEAGYNLEETATMIYDHFLNRNDVEVAKPYPDEEAVMKIVREQ